MSNIVSENFYIEKLIYLPMGTQHPMYNRPYVVNATQQAVETIADRMYETKSGKVTPSLINDVAGCILQPSAVGYQTAINSTWVGTKRYVFLMKVVVIDAFGVQTNSYFQGYTEYDGITNTGNIDEHLVHYVNNVLETRSFEMQTPMGIVRREKLTKIYNVMTNGSMGGSADVYTQRPSDILENINVLNMAGVMEKSDVMAYNLNNYMTPFSGSTVTSSVDNNITTEYLSKILTTGMLANRSKDVFINSSPDSYSINDQNSIEGRIPEPSINDNRFLKYLSRMGGFMNVRETFKFGQLMQIDNTIYNRFTVAKLTKDYVNPLTACTPEVGDYWTGQDPVTVKAYSLIEASVALAVKYGFSNLYFTASNMATPTGMAEVFITNFNSFINLEEHDFNFLLEIFKDKFITEIFLNETNAGTLPLHMEMYVDLLGTSKINLSFAGYPSNWYTVPTTANSMFSPVLTIDRNSFDVTSQHLGTVIDALSYETSTNRQYY